MSSAVFDSTVLISAFLKRDGVSAQLIDLAGGAFTLALAPEITAETRRKLLTSRRIRRRYGYTDEEVGEYCRGLEELAAPVHNLPPLVGMVRDPNDDMIIATAVAAEADYLVTRDKDLLTLGSYQGIGIVTPEAFMGMLRGT